MSPPILKAPAVSTRVPAAPRLRVLSSSSMIPARKMSPVTPRPPAIVTAPVPSLVEAVVLGKVVTVPTAPRVIASSSSSMIPLTKMSPATPRPPSV